MSAMFPVSVTIPVQWGDMDALGHVNNTRYLAWFESARIALFQRVGVATTGAGLGVGPILATTTCDFVVPVVWPATVVASTRVAKVGETSVTMEYEVRDASAADQLYARGTSVIVMFDYRSNRKVRVPDDVRRAIEGLTA
jgi:acyl-CoA thioester hydrolase